MWDSSGSEKHAPTECQAKLLCFTQEDACFSDPELSHMKLPVLDKSLTVIWSFHALPLNPCSSWDLWNGQLLVSHWILSQIFPIRASKMPPVMIFIPSHTLFLWTILWILSYRNNDLLISWSYLLILSFDHISWSCLLIISLDHILSDRWSYLTDDLMFLYISSTCARHILWILLTCFRHVLHTAYARHSFPMLCISCLQHALLMTYTCSPCCLHTYFTI